MFAASDGFPLFCSSRRRLSAVEASSSLSFLRLVLLPSRRCAPCCARTALSRTTLEETRFATLFLLLSLHPVLLHILLRTSTSSFKMATVSFVPMSPTRGHTPMVSTFDPSFSPGSLHLSPFNGGSSSPTSSFGSSSPTLSSQAVAMGSRYEKVPYAGPGSATYVRQPTRAQLVSFALSARGISPPHR